VIKHMVRRGRQTMCLIRRGRQTMLGHTV